MAVSTQLVESGVRHQVYLERLKSGEVNQFAAFLKKVDADIKKQLTREDITTFTRRRLEKLLNAVDRSLGKIFDGYYEELAGHLTDVAYYESEFEARNLSNAVRGYESVIPSKSQVRAAVFSSPLSVHGANGGKLLPAFIKDWTTTERKRVVNSIRLGVFQGKTNFQIINDIRGTKVNAYRDGLLNTSYQNAEAIVRTATQHVANTARFETWQANDLVIGYRIVATLDGRTSDICRSLDGQVFKLGKGPVPPFHIRCRSTTIAELDSRFNFLKEGATRSSLDGSVSANQTYYGWLKTQSPEFQDDIIGKTRGKLLRDGGLSAERFARMNLGRNFTPLSLDDMREREPLAFAKAGI